MGLRCLCEKVSPDKLEPKSKKCIFIEYPKESVGYTFYHRSEGKIFVAKNGSFLEKEFLSKEVSGRKVELDEITVSTPLLESSSSQEPVPVTTTPISEEANDNDHETSDQVTTEPRRSTRVRSNQSGTVILFCKSCYKIMMNLRTMKKRW